VEIRQHTGSSSGRLVDVIPLARANAEHCEQASARKPTEAASDPGTQLPCGEVRDATLVLLNDNGTLSRVALGEVDSVRALDPAIAARLKRALDAMSRRSAAQGRHILHIHGSGSAQLSLGYVAEAPVWRANYRLLLDDSQKAGKIQGFALIHNDTDEPWRGVKLELVNGRPRSFLYPLAAPRYTRRELVTPEAALSTVPQLLTRSADDRWDPNPEGDASAESDGESFSLSGVGEGGGGRGEGIGLGSVGTIGHGSGSSSSASPLLDVGSLTPLNTATGVEGAAQFLYKVGAPIDLGAHASALVPFVSESVSLTRVTWFDDESDQGGQTAVELRNSSAQTLPEGVLSIFSEGGFSGSSLLPRTKPGETRVLRFGLDLDIELNREPHRARTEPKRYTFDGTRLTEHALRKSALDVQLSNKSNADRTVSVALNVVSNVQIEGADETSYDSSLGRGIVSFRLPARESLKRQLKIVEGIETRIAPARVSSEFLERSAKLESVDPAQRAILARAAAKLYQVELRRGALPKRTAELSDTLTDIARLESHVRALGPASAEGRLAASSLRQSEDRVRQLRQRLAALDSEIVEFEALALQILGTLGDGAGSAKLTP
jgi:hypothetical protein